MRNKTFPGSHKPTIINQASVVQKVDNVIQRRDKSLSSGWNQLSYPVDSQDLSGG